jgi:hypothetical protein
MRLGSLGSIGPKHIRLGQARAVLNQAGGTMVASAKRYLGHTRPESLFSKTVRAITRTVGKRGAP